MNRCEGEIFYNHRFYRCTKNGKFNEDGKWFCVVHSPSKLRAAKERRAAIRQQQDNERMKQLEIQERRAALVEACEKLGIYTPDDIRAIIGVKVRVDNE